MRRISFVCCLLGSLAVFSCSSAPGSDSADDPIAETQSRIAYGTADAKHTAVVAVLADAGGGSFDECSGSIVQVKNGNAYVLTAAHCCNMDPPDVVVVSSDYTVGEQYIGGGNPAAPAYAIDPSSIYFDSQYNGNDHDFCMFKFAGPANLATLALPSSCNDGVADGVSIEHVGFGETDTNQNNTGRRTGTDEITAFDNVTISYDQGEAAPHHAGPCEGDSGGPSLIPAGAAQNQQTIVATTSFGMQQTCGAQDTGVGSRVCSEIGPGGFITSFLADTPTGTPANGGSSTSSTSSGGGDPCQTCSDAAQSGTCASQTQTCGNDQACTTLATCVQGCQDQNCVDTCASQAGQAAVNEYNAILDCICTMACVNECAAECGSSSSSSSTSGGPATTSGGNTTSGGPSTTTGAGNGTTGAGNGTTGAGNGTTGAGNGVTGAGTSGAGGASAGNGGGGTQLVAEKSGCSVNAAGAGSDPAPGTSLAGLLLGAAVAFSRRRRVS